MIRRKVYLEQDEKLFSTTEIFNEEQREFGKGDKKGKAKKAAAKRDRQNMRNRYQANASGLGISQEKALEAAKADMADTGVKASKSASQLALPAKQPGSTPKQAEPKPSAKVRKQIESAKLQETGLVTRRAEQSNLPAVVEKQTKKTAEQVTKATEQAAKKGFKSQAENAVKQGKGLFNKALTAAKNNPKTTAAIGATTLTAAAVGTGVAIRKRKKNANKA